MKRFVLFLGLLAGGSLHVFAQVPPADIAGNRSVLLNLVASNFFGQNIPGLAATEADYMEMWAQDATAMYSGHSTTASVDSTSSSIFGPVTMSVDYSGAQSFFSFTSGSIPPGMAGYQLTVNLKSSTPDLAFDQTEPISVFDLENDITVIYSDGVNTLSDTGALSGYEVETVPEPSGWAMVLGGAGALGLAAHRRCGRGMGGLVGQRGSHGESRGVN